MVSNSLKKEHPIKQSDRETSSDFVEKDFADTASKKIKTKSNNVNSKKVQLIMEIEALIEEEGTSNELETVIPSHRIEDVLIVAKRWPNNLPIPNLDFDEEGKIYLDVFNEKGLVVVALLFHGDKNKFAFSIDNVNGDSYVGEYNTRNNSDISKLFMQIEGIQNI